MLTPEPAVNVAFIQSLFGGDMLSQLMMDDMSLIAVAIVLGLIMLVVIALMSMVGGLHVFD